MALSKEKRKILINLHCQKKSEGEIASALNISKRTVIRIIKQQKTSGSLEKKKIPGRPRILTRREERRLVRKVLCQPPRDSVLLASDLTQELGREITARTVRLALYRNGFRGRKPLRKPLLKKEHRQRRLVFAKEDSQKPRDFWENVIFSDEAPFRVFSTPSGQWTWRRPHEKLEARNIIPTVKHGGGTLQIWGCMTSKGIGWMCKLPQGLDAETYKEILDDEATLTAQHYFGGFEKCLFQQDGASVHTSKEVKRHLEKKKIQFLPWPAQSPDLNPIENIWADVKKRVAERRGDITNKQKLWEAIEEEWEATPKDLCRRLIESIPERLLAVIKAKGGPTKY